MPGFRTKARAIELLGKGQIADYPTAISELWKNAYDAYAKHVCVDLYQESCLNTTKPVLCLWDDGIGMDRIDLIERWLVIGTDSKLAGDDIYNPSCPVDMKPRIKMGEKGIGRLSVSFLGEQMLLLSRKAGGKLVALFINWSILQNHKLLLDDIDVPVLEIDDTADIAHSVQRLKVLFARSLLHGDWTEHRPLRRQIMQQIRSFAFQPWAMHCWPVLDSPCNTGTLFFIDEVLPEIARLDLRELQKRNYTEQDNLRVSLVGFVNPFIDEKDHPVPDFAGQFNIHTDSGKYPYIRDVDFFSYQDMDLCDHIVDGKFDEYGNFSGSIKVFDKRYQFEYKHPRRSSRKQTQCGSFTMMVGTVEGMRENSLLAEREVEWRDINSRLETYGGLYVYRDGLRVLPYGRPEADFLRFEEKRSKGAGRYFFSYRRMIGYIGISRLTNRNLEEKAGREGLIVNSAYREFTRILDGFFSTVAAKFFMKKDGIPRADLLAKAQEEKTRIANEARQKRILADFRNDLDKRTHILSGVSGVLERLISDLQHHIDDDNTKIADVRPVAELVTQVLTMMSSLKPDKPTQAELDGIIEQEYREYQRCFAEVEQRLSRAQQSVAELIERLDVPSQRQLLEQYIALLKDNLESMLQTYGHDIQKEFTKRSDEINESMEPARHQFHTVCSEYLASAHLLDSMSSEELASVRTTITRAYDEAIADCEGRYGAYLAQIRRMSPDIPDDIVVGMFRRQYVQLKERLELYSELAELGLAVEIIDHEFNQLYSQMHSSIEGLSLAIPSDSQRAGRLLSQFETAFQHLEHKHRLLSPLYRASRRERVSISGSDIEAYVNQFFTQSIGAGDFELSATTQFETMQLISFRPVIYPVFVNLVDNARYWLRNEEDRHVLFDYDKDRRTIIVSDSGPGIHSDDLERIFRPFFTTKPKGRGLGLHLCQINLASQGFHIYATNDPIFHRLKGATFCIQLPPRGGHAE